MNLKRVGNIYRKTPPRLKIAGYIILFMLLLYGLSFIKIGTK